MGEVYDVAVFVGSLRKASFSRKVATTLIGFAPSSLKLSIIEIGQLPLYNQDEDAKPPATRTSFRERVKKPMRSSSLLRSTIALYPLY